jgi:hypothetical protein
MAASASRSFPTVSLLLSLLFLIHLFSPMVQPLNENEDSLEELLVPSNSPYVTLGDAYGHDFAGVELSFDGLPSATVREESALDYWMSEVFATLPNHTMGTPDLKLSHDEGFDVCWTTNEGDDYVGSLDAGMASQGSFESAWTMYLVDSVSPSNTSSLVDCALAVNENGRQYVLYADGANIKSAHIVFPNSVYSEQTWQKITVLYDVHPTDLEMVVLPEKQLEYAVFRDVNGSLWEMNYSGNIWYHKLLDSGPIGQSLELEIDADGMAHLLYTADDEVRLIRYDGSTYDRRVLLRDSNLADYIGMGLDTNAVEQIATTSVSAGVTSLQLLRSLSGQDEGRIDPVPNAAITASISVEEGESTFADINADGYDDFIYSEPGFSSFDADVGRVSVSLGSSLGLSTTAQSVVGTQAGQRLGSDISVADFNGDGFADVAIGSPGWSTSQANGIGDNGMVEIYLGNASGLDAQSWWNQTGNEGDAFGWKIEEIPAMNGDEFADLAVVSGNYSAVIATTPSEIIHKGKISIFEGDLSGMNHLRNISQTQEKTRLGQSLSGSGDLNGDGYDDLLVSNAASLDSFTGFPRVELYLGSEFGVSATPDQAVVSNLQGKMFGYTIDYIGDVNGDGYDDMMFSELFNSTSAFQAGKVWLYHGSSAGISSSMPNWSRSGEDANAMLGRMFKPAGDVNEDGYDDVLIMQLGGTRAGKVELHLGSSIGLTANYELLASGTPQAYKGLTMSTNGDVDGDGLSEISLSVRQTSGSSFEVVHEMYSERDWESTTFTFNEELTFLDLSTSSRGEASMLLSFEPSQSLHFLEHVDDGTATGVWADKTLPSHASNLTSFAFGGTSSGRPLIVVTEGGNTLKVHTTSSYTALEQGVLTTIQTAQFLGSALDSDGHQHIMRAAPSVGGFEIYVSQEDDSGWLHTPISTGVDLADPIQVVIDTNDTSAAVYRDAVNEQLIFLHQADGNWVNTALGDEGAAVSGDFAPLILSNGDLAVALIHADGPNHNLSVWIYNGSNISENVITGLTDLSSNISMEMTDTDVLMVSSLTSTGVLNVHERQLNGSSWENNSSWNTVSNLAQPTGAIGTFNVDLVGGEWPAMAVRGDSNTDVLYARNSTGHWSSFGHQPDSNADATWDLTVENNTYILMTSNGQSNLLTWNSLNTAESSYHWNSLSFGDISTTGSVGLFTDSNETLHMAFKDDSAQLVKSLRLYVDTDRDLIFDLVDELPHLGNQWADADGDGFGDNAYGPMTDSCPTSDAPSMYFTYGCLDFDNDGYADIDDACNDDSGDSWIDRLGCNDYDQDGWSNNNFMYFDGDVFIFNWKLASDSDGDGYGDNSGPDCCITEYDSGQPDGDLFPFNPSQYKDTDGDGWGDNSSDPTQGDACKWDYGVSFRDRKGCPDSDSDGSSDPSTVGGFEWNTSYGADAWPLDPTQWADSDGDGYGDNGSEGATNPDRFPDNIAAAEDNDSDGHPDRWTNSYNVTDNSTENDGDGLVLDGCPGVFGNSTSPYPGCPDLDGDGWMDSQDEFPTEPTQWLDFDGDGFGDNPNGYQADECPTIVGILEGTSPFVDGTGIGCRFIDGTDDDGDFIPNLEDICPGTDAGLVVNSVGCADNQLDDDEDTVFNHLDICPATLFGDAVDADGCSDAQLLSDDDMDNVAGPADLCPNTIESERDSVDENGCSASERDSDSDGVKDADDQCPDTPQGTPVLSDGCIDESADPDGDGYFGTYIYTLNETSGLRENQSGDAFPSEATQWFDQDGDGYGDNPAGLEADECPLEFGTSFIDYLGCFDDGDGYRDEFEPAGLAGNPTQWEDADYDGLGDNPNGTSPDLCPGTPYSQKDSIDENGCVLSQLDSDDDGVSDLIDNCPNDPAGPDGFTDGCPKKDTSSGDGASSMISSTTLVAIGVGMFVVLLVGILIIRRRGGNYDLDDDEDDWDDDDEEDEPLPFLNSRSAQKPQQRAAPATVRSGPTGSPASSKPSGPPKSDSSGPSSVPPGRGPGGPPKSTSSGPPRGERTPKTAAKKISSFAEEPEPKPEAETSAKVRKAKLNIDLSIFEEWQADDRESAADWVESSLADGENERTILMQLQETGWSAPQSRAIFNIGRSR